MLNDGFKLTIVRIKQPSPPGFVDLIQPLNSHHEALEYVIYSYNVANLSQLKFWPSPFMNTVHAKYEKLIKGRTSVTSFEIGTYLEQHLRSLNSVL